jgi:GxxExxY protein
MHRAKTRRPRKGNTALKNIEALSAIVVDTAFHLHRDLGPGLLESVYESILATLLRDEGLAVTRQKAIPIHFGGLTFDEGFRADLVIEDCLLIELKSIARSPSKFRVSRFQGRHKTHRQ